MQQLGLEYSSSALVQYYRGVALLWAGYPSDATAALELAKRLGTNTIIQGRADDLLHPQYFQPSGESPPYPVFVPVTSNPLLERGSVLQSEGHQESAERLYVEATKRSPDDPEAQVAAAVALFDEDNLDPSFSRLGELTARFPKSQAVHFYLGLLLAWTSQASLAITQFEDTVKLGPKSERGKASLALLRGVAKSGSSGLG
jgi:tetratricopeptide (TPR) repeat protein